MNELDQFIKHNLKITHYARYTDDFVIIADTKEYLEQLVPFITKFLHEKLSLDLHPKKISVRSLYQGIDFLGYVLFPHHRLLRTKTRHRIFRKFNKRVDERHEGAITTETLEQSLQSYLGVLSHANAHTISEDLKNRFWLG